MTLMVFLGIGCLLCLFVLWLLLYESNRAATQGLDYAMSIWAERERLETAEVEVGHPVCGLCGKHISTPDTHDLTCWLYSDGY